MMPEIASPIGLNALTAMFLACWATSPKVFGICWNSASMSPAAPSMAALTMSDVTLPSAATFFSSPTDRPIYFAIRWAICGALDMTMLRSWPRSTPVESA